MPPLLSAVDSLVFLPEDQREGRQRRSPGVVSSDGYSTIPRWDKAASLRSRFNSDLLAQTIHSFLSRALFASGSTPGAPNPRASRRTPGSPRLASQPPLVRPELVGGCLRIGQAATLQQLVDDFGENSPRRFGVLNPSRFKASAISVPWFFLRAARS